MRSVALSTSGAACGGDGDSSSGGATTPSDRGTTTSAAAASTSSDGCQFEGATTPVSAPALTDVLLLTDVRMAGHPCFDRIVFDFSDPGAPGYEVEYVSGPITMDGSGNPVEVQGAAFHQIRMPSASGFDIDAGTTTYTGPGRLTAKGTTHAREAVRAGDFEAILTWVVGLDEQRPFNVSTLGEPTRLVVDIG